MAKSKGLLRLAVLAMAALALKQLAFIAPAASAPKLRGDAAVAGVTAAMLAAQPALATDQASDSFGPPEVISIIVPIVFVAFFYLEWEAKQAPVDDITGPGTLGIQVDGPTPDKPAYFRRGPESG
eukprot:gb/GFBE01036527.1/.p1 GENE.gb/GFBE01036527.1/~~gb/GFBE01036527.1/.p1  ORF type:complete len:125 (+),score=38.60 gb/GFBE01036527.1/:1-375(+)